MRIDAGRRVVPTLLVLLAGGLARGAPGAAQIGEWVSACQGDSALGTRCVEGALLAQSVLGGVGLSQAGPGALVGSSSTLGRRFGTTPRVALTVRGGLTRFPLPELREASVRDGTVTAGSVHGGVVVGLFDGFAPQPTLGGLLGLDLLLSGDLVFLPGDQGFDGSAFAWGYGVRLGILRESFTLPGITLSATRRHGDDVAVRPPGPSTEVSLRDMTTISLRGEVGKELWGLGFLAGAGWDRYEADAALRLDGISGGNPELGLSTAGFEADRALFFAGVSRTFVVWQLAGEFGWARGFGDGSADVPAFDAGEGSLFGTVSLRLTL